MLKIKEWNTAYWGYIRTASESYPCHPSVNAFIGPSGGGKTTLMDALRIALGDARFENNRSMDHYINPCSNWAVVKVSFWNRSEENRPFHNSGYRKEEVTICVRLDKSKGKCEREYYVFDGEFNNISDLGQNPRLYKSRHIPYKEYLDLLELAGITEPFRKLMTMRPEDVQNIVDLQSHELFQKVFQLKGQKEIQETHDVTKDKVRELMNQEEITSKELLRADEKLQEYEAKKQLYEKNKDRKAEYDKLYKLLLKRRYWDGKNDLKNQIEEQRKTEEHYENLIEEKELLIDDLWITYNELNQVKDKHNIIKRQLNTSIDTKISKNQAFTQIESSLENLYEDISNLQLIKVESVDKLQSDLENERKLQEKLVFRKLGLEKDKEELDKQLKLLSDDRIPFPHWVTRYHEALEQKRIPAIMLANCISVIKEYEPWLRAIEAYLGRERFRTIIPDPYQLVAKELQEEFEYGARVSRQKSSQRAVNSRLLRGKYASMRNALQVNQEPYIGAYLDSLNDVYLVDTVEEGHQLQAEGYKTITRKGLLQDQDGALFLKVDQLVCGRFARETYKQQLKEKYIAITEELEATNIELESIKKVIFNLDERLKKQHELQKLPIMLEERNNLQMKLELTSSELEQAERQYSELCERDEEAQNSMLQLTVLVTQYDDTFKNLIEKIRGVEGSLGGYRGNIAKCRQLLQAAEVELIRDGYDEHALEFIDYEVTNDKIFTRKDGSEWTLDILNDRVNELKEAIERFKFEYKEINEGIVAMVEPQKALVIRLKDELDKVKSDREEWQIRLTNAELALRYHVRETMNQYIEEFKGMAELLGAKASGKFDQEGELNTQWKLNLKLAFDGKDLKPYFDPGFSKGQRAAISIMLLLSAVNNKHEGSKNSIMFLDEPTSRVDDYRANEIGLLLQRTSIQYFITHQVSASLQSVEWIDYAYIISKLREGQTFADNPIFESRKLIV